MKKEYYFKLTESKIPKIKGGVLIKDSNVGGIKNSYKVYVIIYLYLFNKYKIKIYRRFLGIQSFLRPYKTLWPKTIDRLPKVYWGKHPIYINMWLLLIGDYNNLKESIEKKRVLAYGCTTQSAIVFIFNSPFESKVLKKHLESNKSFSINQKH